MADCKSCLVITGQSICHIVTREKYQKHKESLTYILAADSMGLCLLLFTQLSLKFERCGSKSADGKTYSLASKYD